MLVVACACLLSQPAQADVTRTGTLQATVFDDFRGGDSVTRYTLKSGERKTVVRPTRLRAEPGDRVSVTGEMRDGRLVGTVEATSPGAQAQAVVPGPRKTAVILVTFPGHSAEPWPREAARSEVFTAAGSVSAFYEGESYGEISLTGKLREDGDVFGWYGLDTPTAGCPYNTWKGEADKAATAAGVDLSGYQHLIYEFPYQSSCPWLGTAAAGGSWSMINGNFLGFRAQVTAHELGHNLGLWHAGSWTCHAGGVRVQISDTCTAGEYGDPFDVMGNGGFRHNNGWNLAKLGILAPENVETIEASGTYSIESALDPTTAPTVLRIPRTRNLNGNIASWYYLEVRETGGVFENVADASTTGVSVRATRAGLSPETLLLDANPGTASFHDAPLAAGKTFDGGPVRIRTLSAGGGNATVSVELDEEPPAAPAGLSATPGFEQVQLQWEPSADDHGVHRYIVFRDGSEVGVSASNSFSDSPVSVGEHEYVVYAEDMLGNRSDASQPLPVTVEPDEEPPSAPTGLTATVVFEGVQLQWQASTDNFGVDRYLVYRNGSQVGSASSTSFLDSLVPAGEHEYRVYARDETGNQSTASEPATATMSELSAPECAAGACEVTVRYSGATTAWQVPAGVEEAEFTVEGARGGGLGFNLGARVVATIGSLAGETVAVSVGGRGEPFADGGAGGFNGGGDGTLGDGGGGFSKVELESAGPATSLKLLAGGGGGSGAAGFDASTEVQRRGGSGGRGGGTGTSGSPGATIADALGASLGGGKGGTRGADGEGVGGAGGEVSGASACASGAGAGGTGADGESFAGGGGAPGAGAGGGGGYTGGGQGGGGAVDACGSIAGSGGGGGGSSYAAPGLSAEFYGNVRNGDGQVSIAYANPVKAGKRSYTTERDQELVVPAPEGVLAGASTSGAVLSASEAVPPAHGALALNGDGSFSYTPAPGYVGDDSFAFLATDAAGNYASATVTLTIAKPRPRPEPPSDGDEDGDAGGGPGPPVPIFETPLPVPRTAVAIAARRAWAVRGAARVKLACRGGAPGSACRGVLSLSRKGLLGRTRYALASGRARWVTVRLRPRPRRWLRRAGRLRVLATATTPGGNARRVTVLAPLRRAPAHRLR